MALSRDNMEEREAILRQESAVEWDASKFAPSPAEVEFVEQNFPIDGDDY
jgi:hypothetical protein